MKILVLGMGSPILSDDGVGLEVVARLEPLLPGATCLTTHMVGLDLIDLVVGYDQVFLVDALVGPAAEKGALRKLEHDGTSHAVSSHGVNFFQLLEMGRRLGMAMPEVGGVYAIAIGEEVFFGEGLSPELARRLPALVEAIAEDIRSSLPTPLG